MFILRRITSEMNEANNFLGEGYNFTRKSTQPDEFYRTYKVYLEQDSNEVITEEFKKSVDNDVYGFIVYNYGKDIMPLFKLSQYYVMTSDGKTFSNITER